MIILRQVIFMGFTFIKATAWLAVNSSFQPTEIKFKTAEDYGFSKDYR
jgi:hypothetical protein